MNVPQLACDFGDALVYSFARQMELIIQVENHEINLRWTREVFPWSTN